MNRDRKRDYILAGYPSDAALDALARRRLARSRRSSNTRDLSNGRKDGLGENIRIGLYGERSVAYDLGLEMDTGEQFRRGPNLVHPEIGAIEVMTRRPDRSGNLPDLMVPEHKEEQVVRVRAIVLCVWWDEWQDAEAVGWAKPEEVMKRLRFRPGPTKPWTRSMEPRELILMRDLPSYGPPAQAPLF
jgi:hypothetical protein